MRYEQIVKEVVQHFGRASLRTWPLTTLQDVELSSRSQSFLTEVGLPAVADMFSPLLTEVPGLPELPSIEQLVRPRQLGVGNYLLFALEPGFEANPVFAISD